MYYKFFKLYLQSSLEVEKRKKLIAVDLVLEMNKSFWKLKKKT